LGGFDELIDVVPEDLELGVLEIPEIVALDGVDEQTDSGEAHNDGRRDRYPG
jgi:hypothetical protein